jgi:hypothetical protein
MGRIKWERAPAEHGARRYLSRCRRFAVVAILSRPQFTEWQAWDAEQGVNSDLRDRSFRGCKEWCERQLAESGQPS